LGRGSKHMEARQPKWRDYKRFNLWKFAGVAKRD